MAAIADRASVMHAGQIIMTGAPEEAQLAYP
jgi:ABC-type branched-subunit amino acid transport system ATPase component